MLIKKHAIGCCMPTSHHEAQQQRPCRSSDHTPGLQSLFALHSPPTSRRLQEGNAAFRPGGNSFELHLCASRYRPSLQPPEVYSLYCVMGALQPRACRVRPGLRSAEQLGRGLRCRRDGRFRMETTHVQDSDGRMIYAMLQV